MQNRLLWLTLALVLLAQVGCRQRAVTEMYVEQMAQRNRALEDLVYDFDAENRAMEFEIEDLRRANAQLQGRLQEIQRQSSRPQSDTMIVPDSKRKADRPAPLKIPPSEGKSGSDKSKTSNGETLRLEPLEVVIPKKSGEPELIPDSAPILPTPEPLLKKPVVPKDPASELLPEIAPPTIPPVIPPAGPESLLKQAPAGLPSSPSDGANKDRKIQLPTVNPPEGASGVIQTSAFEPALKNSKSKPGDLRVRQIDWHPTMCRAQNTDGKPGDDGLYLVLVPSNNAGEFVPSTGSLTLVVEETLADGSVSRIGRYEYTAEELREQLEPIGTAPGLHLPIRFRDRIPSGSSVDVYAKFTSEDGTTMVNRRTIQLRKSVAAGPSNWVPR
ncbi:MAG: hypothetical protein ACKN9S_02805 [Pirellula sp.]